MYQPLRPASLLLVLLLSASGCATSVTSADFDGDGVGDAEDCDPEDGNTFPGAPDRFGDGVDQDCDGFDGIDRDGDGAPVQADDAPEDCNDNRADIHPGAEDEVGDATDQDCDGVDGVDADADGQASVASGGLDCDDQEPTVHTLMEEVCGDSIDQDCSGTADDLDRDNDGHLDPACGGDDCDDQNPSVHPDRVDQCDGVDADCSGTADDRDVDGDGRVALDCGGDDCDDTSAVTLPGATELVDGVDNDCDGAIDEGSAVSDDDGDGSAEVDGDCDDTEPAVNAGLPELCGDGLDNDCSGRPDDLDADGDGVVAPECGGPDCDDGDAQQSPLGTEVCDDGVDQDCSGVPDDLDADSDGSLAPACGGGDCDDADPAISPFALELCGNAIDEDCSGAADDRDLDGDGWIAEGACGGDDCDDESGVVFPGGLEFCDGGDGDCDGVVDNRDLDLDGAVDEACGGDDCNDLTPLAGPTAVEIVDGADNDCDGLIDDGTPVYDDDGDGFCDASFCVGGALPDDCDDNASRVFPGAPEICNDGIDDDCDPADDEGLDMDGDGYSACAGDCDGADPLANPSGFEVAGDGIDNDCDGLVDPAGSPTCDLIASDATGLITLATAGPLAPGATLCLAPGSFVLDPSMLAAGQRVVGIAGPEATFVGGYFTIEADLDGLELQGLTFDNVLFTSTYESTLTVNGADVILRDLVIETRDLDPTMPASGGVGLRLTDSDTLVEDVVIRSNNAGVPGHVLNGTGLLIDGGAPTLRRVTIEGNSSISEVGGGGGMAVLSGDVTAEDLVIHDNATQGTGGGLYLEGGTGTFDALRVTDNSASSGGGVAIAGGDWTFNDVHISGNTAGSGAGGGVWVGPGATLDMNRAWLSTNTALTTGGGLHVDGGTVTGTNVLLDGGLSGAGGAAVYNEGGGSTSLDQVVIANNDAAFGPDGVLASDGPGLSLSDCAVGQNNGGPDGLTSAPSTDISFVRCSFDFGGTPNPWDPVSPIGSDGNVEETVAFVDWFRLQPGSGLIDAGDPTLLDPDGTPADRGLYGGPGAGPFDQDGDGYPVPFAVGGQTPADQNWWVRTSEQPSGPSFDWIDLQNTGTALTLGDEDHAVVPIGFPFYEYGPAYQSDTAHLEVSVQSNGALVFADETLPGTNEALPAGGPTGALVAPYWDDLDPSTGGAVLYETTGLSPTRTFTVHWRQVPHVSGAGPVDFQVTLHEWDSTIEFRYLTVDGSAAGDGGAHATIGAQNSPAQSVQIGFDEAAVSDGLAVRLRLWDPNDSEPGHTPVWGSP